jgi:hypothetical protein
VVPAAPRRMRSGSQSTEDLPGEWRRVHGFTDEAEPQLPAPDTMRRRAEAVAEAVAGLDDVRAAIAIREGLLIARPGSRALRLLKAILRVETAR